MNKSDDNEFNLGPRYQFVKYLGKGAYGVVGELFDTKSNLHVAIKKIPLAPSHMEYDEQVVDAKKILREINEAEDKIELLEFYLTNYPEFEIFIKKCLEESKKN